MHLILTHEAHIIAILILRLRKLMHQEAQWLAQSYQANRWWSKGVSSRRIVPELPPKHCMLPPAVGGGVQVEGGRWGWRGLRWAGNEAGDWCSVGLGHLLHKSVGFILQIVWRHWRLISEKQIKLNEYFWTIILEAMIWRWEWRGWVHWQQWVRRLQKLSKGELKSVLTKVATGWEGEGVSEDS